jgi:hypothetical protein
MTLVASILFLSAFATSVIVIAATVGDAMPRIADIIEAEFAPALQRERRISFGPVKQRQVARIAEVVAFPGRLKNDQEFMLAA